MLILCAAHLELKNEPAQRQLGKNPDSACQHPHKNMTSMAINRWETGESVNDTSEYQTF